MEKDTKNKILATEFFKDFFKKVNKDKIKLKFNVNDSGKFKPDNDDGLEHYALDFLLKNDKDWVSMNSWREAGSANNNLDKCEYVVTFAQYYHYGSTYYLFGGIYKVVDIDYSISNGAGYKLELQNDFVEYKGRLLLKMKENLSRTYNIKYKTFEKYNPEVYAILPVANFGEFTGYQNVRLSFNELEQIIKQNDPQWKNALENVKGIYVITDKKTGKLYIGSAYGKYHGIWGRWSTYIETHTGGNNGLQKILKKNGKEYIEDNFQYSILEIFDTKTKDDYIINRENYWKKVFSSKEHGMNEN